MRATRRLRLDSTPYAPGVRHAPHWHDDLQITIVLRGHVEERVGSAVERAGALSAVVKDPGVTHADEFGGEGALTARLSIPGATFADFVEDSRRAQSWGWTHGGRVAGPFLRLVRRGARGESSFVADDDDVSDLFAALSARPVSGAAGEPPVWLREAVSRIFDGWQPGLSVRDVARESGVHPVYLARCVRRWHQVSAAELIRRARLQRAAHALNRASSTVSAVAHDHGFADEPHLCRAFSEATGITPAGYRRLAREFGRLPTVA